jgi:DNA-binding transcriptional MerR regulator
MGMTTQNIFIPAETISEIDVSSDSLESIRSCLAATGFELKEIREFKDGKRDETWTSPTNDNQVRINVVLHEGGAEQDATRKELVNEVIDLWFELRAIRNLLAEDLDEPLVKNEETPMERFFSSVQDFRNERENAPDAWRFMFSSDVDETICAFNDLRESDRLAIIQ